MHIIFAIVVVTSGLVAVKADEYPSTYYLHICNRNQELSKLEKCLQNSIESVKNYSKRHNPFGIPKFDLYEVSNGFTFTTMENFIGTLFLYDIKIEGMTEYVISNVHITPNLYKINFDVYFQHLDMRAIYRINATVLDMKINAGQHRLEAELLGTKVTVTIEGSIFFVKRYFENSPRITEFFKVENVEVDLSMRGSIFYFAQIDSNVGITAEINEMLQRSYISELQPGILRQLKPVVTEKIRSLAHNIYSSVPMNILMPY